MAVVVCVLSLTRGGRLHELREVPKVPRVGQDLGPFLDYLSSGLDDIDSGTRVLCDLRSRLDHLVHCLGGYDSATH